MFKNFPQSPSKRIISTFVRLYVTYFLKILHALINNFISTFISEGLFRPPDHSSHFITIFFSKGLFLPSSSSVEIIYICFSQFTDLVFYRNRHVGYWQTTFFLFIYSFSAHTYHIAIATPLGAFYNPPTPTQGLNFDVPMVKAHTKDGFHISNYGCTDTKYLFDPDRNTVNSKRTRYIDQYLY